MEVTGIIPMTRALRGRGDEGNPLPPVYKALEKLGARPRRGQLTLVAGAPGGGKTALVLNWVLKSGLPTAYVSADSDASTLAERVSANLLGKTVDEMQLHFSKRDAVYEQALQAIHQKANRVMWDFGKAPDIASIEGSVKQFNYLYQEDPAIIVADNLKNIWADSESDGQDHVRYDRVIDGLRQIGGATGAAVFVLHHVVGEYENGDKPIPLGGLLGKVSKDFSLVLTIHRGGMYQNVSVTKNRTGKSDPTGNLIAPIPFAPERMAYQEDYDPADPNPPWHSVNLAGAA